jgi:hypothetical protein
MIDFSEKETVPLLAAALRAKSITPEGYLPQDERDALQHRDRFFRAALATYPEDERCIIRPLLIQECNRFRSVQDWTEWQEGTELQIIEQVHALLIEQSPREQLL